MYKNTFTHYLAKVLVDITFFLGIPCVLTVFWWTKFLRPYLVHAESHFSFIAVILALSGTAALYAIWQIKKMFATIELGNPFVEENITCLRKCAVCSFVVSIIFLVKEIVIFTIASSLIIIIFAFLGLFCLTIKDLFKQAIAYKQENDWTV